MYFERQRSCSSLPTAVWKRSDVGNDMSDRALLCGMAGMSPWPGSGNASQMLRDEEFVAKGQKAGRRNSRAGWLALVFAGTEYGIAAMRATWWSVRAGSELARGNETLTPLPIPKRRRHPHYEDGKKRRLGGSGWRAVVEFFCALKPQRAALHCPQPFARDLVYRRSAGRFGRLGRA